MCINDRLSQCLSLLTYNENYIKTPKDDQINIFLGIGLWSVKDGLSEGLPVDVMQMLLSATLMRLKIKEANPEKSSGVVILIADSMAIREGAGSEKVAQIVQIYKRSLEPLLELLKIREWSEIILSSDLEKCMEFQKALESVEKSKLAEQIKIEDEVHYAYISTQTAITHYMEKYRKVGIKVGWICAESSKQLNGSVSPKDLKQWDELKFDRWCYAICQNSATQYLYAKAGLKQSGHIRSISVIEGCPYTAYTKDQRYVVHLQGKREIKTICPLQKRVSTHWKGIAEVCLSLMQANLVSSALLPVGCIKKSNLKATVYDMLNHWCNPPPLPIKTVCNLASISLLSTDSPTLEDSDRQLTMLDVGDLTSKTDVENKPKMYTTLINI